MEKNVNYDVSNLVFVYENLVSFLNNVCLDIDVINKLGYFEKEMKINSTNKDAFHFIERRTFLSLVVTLDILIDNTNAKRPEQERIRNNGINLDKLLCCLQDVFRNEKDNKKSKELNETYLDLRKHYDDLQSLNERKALEIFRNKLAAHLDISFIKKEEYSKLDFTVWSAMELVARMLDIVSTVRKMIVSDRKLLEIIPYDPKRSTPVDKLF